MRSPIFPVRMDPKVRARLEELSQQTGKPMATCVKTLLMAPAALEILGAVGEADRQEGEASREHRR